MTRTAVLSLLWATALVLGCTSGPGAAPPTAPSAPVPLPTRRPTPAFDPCGQLAFARPTTIQAGQGPHSITVGDFSGDGRPDLAVVDPLSDAVTLLLADGAGGFGPAQGSPTFVGRGPLSAAAGDLDGDGRLDLALANSRSDDVWVLLGDGAGGLRPAPGSPHMVGTGPMAIAAGDFTRDGKLDLAVGIAGGPDAGVAILLGDGTGRFSLAPGSPLRVKAGPAPVTIAADDFNRDGVLDLALATAPTDDVTLLLGDDTGTLRPASGAGQGVGGGPVSIAVGDFNADGTPDLATANSRTNDVSVLLGDGAGRLGPAPGAPYGVIDGPVSVASDDLDGDGILDLVVVVVEADDVSFLRGDGAGTFREVPPPPRIITGGRPANPSLAFAQFVTTADLNGDGKPDLAVANPGSGDVSVLLNTCTPR